MHGPKSSLKVLNRASQQMHKKTVHCGSLNSFCGLSMIWMRTQIRKRLRYITCTELQTAMEGKLKNSTEIIFQLGASLMWGSTVQRKGFFFHVACKIVDIPHNTVWRALWDQGMQVVDPYHAQRVRGLGTSYYQAYVIFTIWFRQLLRTMILMHMYCSLMNSHS